MRQEEQGDAEVETRDSGNGDAPVRESLGKRRAFLKLPMEERRRLLAIEAVELAKDYEENCEEYKEWMELQGGDFIEY